MGQTCIASNQPPKKRFKTCSPRYLNIMRSLSGGDLAEISLNEIYFKSNQQCFGSAFQFSGAMTFIASNSFREVFIFKKAERMDIPDLAKSVPFYSLDTLNKSAEECFGHFFLFRKVLRLLRPAEKVK